MKTDDEKFRELLQKCILVNKQVADFSFLDPEVAEENKARFEVFDTLTSLIFCLNNMVTNKDYAFSKKSFDTLIRLLNDEVKAL